MSGDHRKSEPAARAAALARLRGPGITISLAGASGHRLHAEGVLRPLIALGEGSLRGRSATCHVDEQLPDGRLRPVHTLNVVDHERLDLAVMERAF